MCSNLPHENVIIWYFWKKISLFSLFWWKIGTTAQDFSDQGLVKSVNLKESRKTVCECLGGITDRGVGCRSFHCDVDIRWRSCAIYIRTNGDEAMWRHAIKPCAMNTTATWPLFWNVATTNSNGKLKNKYCFNLFYRMIIIDNIVRFLIKRSILRRILHGIWHANDLKSWPKFSVPKS